MRREASASLLDESICPIYDDGQGRVIVQLVG